MGVLVLVGIVAVIVLFKKVYESGQSDGRSAREREFANETNARNAEIIARANALDQREHAIEQRECEIVVRNDAVERRDAVSKALYKKAEEYRASSKAALVDAEKRFAEAYENGVKKREDELRLIIHSLLSQQPNNRHFVHVLSDAEAFLIDKQIEDALSSRAPITAKEMQRRFSESHKKDRALAQFYKYQCELYEELVPRLLEYKEDEDEIKTDVVKTDESDWLSDEEYRRLSPEERSQLALDRYVKSSNKSKWQVGRDFELFVGYEYRRDGWKVEQTGIKDGLQDLGRDLICKKGSVTHIVQCKYWSKEKTIHEKHIAQLYGTTVAYRYEHELFKTSKTSLYFSDLKQQEVVPVFVTSTEISEQARKFATALGVKVVVNKEIAPFPRIKCNVAKDGDKIYHLPFDQQYDTTMVNEIDGDCYAMDVKEAVAKGFRRAKRHLFST